MNLVRRGLGGDPFCPFCLNQLETTAHIFFECDRFAEIWGHSPFSISLPHEQWPFANWFRFLRTKLDGEECLLAAVVCWRVWWLRNQLIHGSKEDVGGDVVEWAAHFLEAYKTAQIPKLRTTVKLLDKWIPRFTHPDFFQVAVVVRDEGGSCLWWKTRRLAGQPSAVVGEARAALEGVRLALEKGWREVILEGDCAQIIAAVQSRVQDSLLPFGLLVSEVILISSSFHDFSCSFVKRTGNRLAHALALGFCGSSCSSG